MDTIESSRSSKTVHVSNPKEWSEVLHSQHRPLLIHINADTTWLIQIPYPKSQKVHNGRSHFNTLLDPWLQGPQTDVARWFSTQWHVVPPSVATIADLSSVLQEVEDPEGHAKESQDSFIDAVAISHEFTDHCHKATLLELPKNTPVYAADVAAKIIKGWDHFLTIVTLPVLDQGVHWSKLTAGPLPNWIAIGRVTTPKNNLHFHSAILLAFSHSHTQDSHDSTAEAIIYSPHGIRGQSLTYLDASRIDTLALLHGVDDIRIWKAKQLNLGALNGIRAVGVTGARYWIATHDEDKTSAGIIAPLLKRTTYTLKEAVDREQERMKELDRVPDYQFKQLGSGHGLVLE